ncbi:MAG: hypothetical protein IH840_06940 [Candidatus Heimdallarchaeota archaeon]|nr:hypothetical protein [Candidatus Heimdallarchaeota archaeon]
MMKQWRGKILDQKKTQTWLLLVILVGSLISFTSLPYAPEFSIYNSNWNGTSQLRLGLQIEFGLTSSRILISPIILNSDVDYPTIVIIGSERKYTNVELSAYSKYVRQGGHLVIFEDYGPARRIAQQMGIQFIRGMIRETQESFYINRPSQILIQDIFGSYLLGIKISPLIGSEVVGLLDLLGMEEGITVPILVSFNSSFADLNNNKKMDAGDIATCCGFPVGLHKRLENGTITVIGDSAIPLNVYANIPVTFVKSDGSESTFIASNIL